MMVSIGRPPQLAASFIFRLASGMAGPYLNSEPTADKVPPRRGPQVAVNSKFVVRFAGNLAKIRHMTNGLF
jgi:hypothetical protein